MSKVKADSLVKKFAKGAPVSVERGGDPENMHQNDKLRTDAFRDAERKGDIEAGPVRAADLFRRVLKLPRLFF